MDFQIHQVHQERPADAAVVCNTPIVLLNEVENAGIHRTRVLELLRRYQKIFIFVTHDPRIALLSDYRIVISEGRVAKILYTDENEQILCQKVSKLDDMLSRLRDKLRFGHQLYARELEASV